MNTFRSMTRSLFFFVALLPLIVFSLSGQASAIDLKAQSVVSGNTITLGDIFTGLGQNESRVLGAAPLPGQNMVLNARTLMRIAIALDLPWRPNSSADQIVLRRAATIIDGDMIDDVLKNELTNKGVRGKFSLVLSNDASKIVLPEGTLRSVEIDTLTFIPGQGSFEAVLVAPSKANPLQRVRVQGQIQRLIDVPVLRATLNNGTIIGIRDLDTIEMPERRLKHNIIVSAEQLIGMTPRRILFANEPVMTSDIEAPRIVSRGDNVTMVFKQSGMVLTTQGKAMEYGAKGDVIRVVNVNSSKSVDALVTGENEVTVLAF